MFLCLSESEAKESKIDIGEENYHTCDTNTIHYRGNKDSQKNITVVSSFFLSCASFISVGPTHIMEPTNILPLLEQLDDDIDDLEEVLQPLLQNPLSVVTQKLPVLDKAKLHVLLTYTIESLIFCAC